MSVSEQSVFISYAHLDGLEFTRRIAFALGLYMDVFWDRRLKSGKFPEQLENEVKSRDYFLFVLTPASVNSEWCRRELEFAIESESNSRNGKIALARIYPHNDEIYYDFTQNYTYCDFTIDFDIGFKRCTQMFLGEPLSSWEYIANKEDDISVLEDLSNGRIPGLLSKQLATRVLIEYIWPEIRDYSKSTDRWLTELNAQPRTATGMLRMSSWLIQNFAQATNAVGAQHATGVSELTLFFKSHIVEIADNEHGYLGENTFQFVSNVKDHLIGLRSGRLEAMALHMVNNFFYFNVAEMLREIVVYYSTTARHLY